MFCKIFMKVKFKYMHITTARGTVFYKWKHSRIRKIFLCVGGGGGGFDLWKIELIHATLLQLYSKEHGLFRDLNVQAPFKNLLSRLFKNEIVSVLCNNFSLVHN